MTWIRWPSHGATRSSPERRYRLFRLSFRTWPKPSRWRGTPWQLSGLPFSSILPIILTEVRQERTYETTINAPRDDDDPMGLQRQFRVGAIHYLYRKATRDGFRYCEAQEGEDVHLVIIVWHPQLDPTIKLNRQFQWRESFYPLICHCQANKSLLFYIHCALLRPLNH